MMSLRARVTVSSMVVLAAVLVAVTVLTEVVFVAQSNADLRAAVSARAALAAELAGQGVGDAEIARQVSAPGIRVILLEPGDRAPLRPPEPRRRGPADQIIDQPLPDGSRLLLIGEAGPVSSAQERLRRILVLLALAALAVAGFVTLWTTKLALRPLDTMTALARSIARGDRGRRLAPVRTDTELGRTAAAFDDMLDALERSEAAAVASEARTRQFVADAAHELRTPLAGMHAVVEAVMDPALPADQREQLHLLLLRESRRAGRLVEDLLALARIDAGIELQREPVDLLELARAEIDRARLLDPDRPITLDGSSSVVDGDPARLAQVLANLLDNARKHTPPRTPVAVHVGDGRLRVTDRGPGIPAADRERIFDRLVRLDTARTAGGAGLGLAIARGIARAHGGDLRCLEPASGTGAVFELSLPVRDAAAQSSSSAGVTLRT
ncbi:Signal transduction histidine kinase [Pseudonocardia thermophila]|uniref:histidine kinase n=2 Tax=Pseudonocardia thermophila TaxID=1848 RepID=A0A1M6WAF2_PSETH|nr:Signal transduction histidine kinase [Pseudonocardia thermophila]